MSCTSTTKDSQDQEAKAVYEQKLAELENAVSHTVKTARETLPLFLADEKLFYAEPFFKVDREKGDAGPYLNELVVWDGLAEGAAQKRKLYIKEEIRSPKNKDASFADMLSGHKKLAVDVNKIDFSWMARLPEFSHWQIDEFPAHSDRCSYVENIFSQRTPNLMILKNWATLRLIKAWSSGDKAQLLQAFRENRALAKLLYSTDTLIGTIVTLQILTQEKFAFEQFALKDASIAGEFTPIEKNLIKRGRRFFFAQQMYLNPFSYGATGYVVPPDAHLLCPSLREMASSFVVNQLYGSSAADAVATRNLSSIIRQVDCGNSLGKWLISHEADIKTCPRKDTGPVEQNLALTAPQIAILKNSKTYSQKLSALFSRSAAFSNFNLYTRENQGLTGWPTPTANE